MPAIFSSTYVLKPWISDTTTTTAATPIIIPNSVSAERNLCAQMAATASFNVSMNFMVRSYYGTAKGLVASGARAVRPPPGRRGEKGEGGKGGKGKQNRPPPS